MHHIDIYVCFLSSQTACNSSKEETSPDQAISPVILGQDTCSRQYTSGVGVAGGGGRGRE